MDRCQCENDDPKVAENIKGMHEIPCQHDKYLGKENEHDLVFEVLDSDLNKLISSHCKFDIIW